MSTVHFVFPSNDFATPTAMLSTLRGVWVKLRGVRTTRSGLRVKPSAGASPRSIVRPTPSSRFPVLSTVRTPLRVHFATPRGEFSTLSAVRELPSRLIISNLR